MSDIDTNTTHLFTFNYFYIFKLILIFTCQYISVVYCVWCLYQCLVDIHYCAIEYISCIVCILIRYCWNANKWYYYYILKFHVESLTSKMVHQMVYKKFDSLTHLAFSFPCVFPLHHSFFCKKKQKIKSTKAPTK
jgi:hypothetical protein